MQLRTIEKKIALQVFIVLVFLLLQPAYMLAMNISEHYLDNGLKVLIVEDHKAPTATFQIWYRVGSRDEDHGKTGMSHLLEHLMFKGTEKYGPKTFSQMIKRAGGNDNAFTSHEYTGYFEIISSDRIDLPIELEADRMINLKLTEQSVISERDVVMEERRLRYEDDPQNLLHEEVIAAAFKNHPVRWPVIGWMSDLKQIELDDIIKHYREYYVPNNAVIIIVGDVSTSEMLSKIKSTFGNIPAGKEIRRKNFEENEQRGERRIYLKKEAELPYMLSVYKVPNLKHEDSFALDILGTILSGGKGSRLYRALVYEKQIATNAWASYEGLSKDPYLFYVAATAAYGKSIEDVEKALLEEIEKIKKDAPTEYEVQKAKNQTEASFIMDQDSIYMQAKTIGQFEMTVGWRFIDRYLEGIRSVTPEDVSRVAREYLINDKKTTGILIPIGEKNR